MYSLRRFPGRTGTLGTPLPDPFPSFALHRVIFRYGGVSMIAGAPGSFKSVLALNMFTEWATQGLCGLYFSADSDEFTVAKRLSGIVTGDSSDYVESKLAKGWSQTYTDALGKIDECTRVVYSQCDVDDIALHMRAFEAVYGCFPGHVFVDNLIDTIDDPTDWGGMIQVLRDLDGLARETQAHICVLHHASEAWAKDNPGRPPPSWAIQGKVTQIPRLALTVGAMGLALSVACVKNTNGPADPTARMTMPFLVQPSMRVDDIGYQMEAK